MNVSRYEGLDALRILCSFGVVFFHVYIAMGSPVSLDLSIKLRDFALPVMVLASFFLLTKSLMRKRESGSCAFFGCRVKLLWLPLIIWTFFYCSALTFVFPHFWGAGARPEFPSPIVFLIGYRHLWYLQFAFVASAIVYLFLTVSAKLRISTAKLAYACFAASLIYGVLYYSTIKNYAVWDSFASEFDISFGIFISQGSYYTMYIPTAVGLALISDRIKEWSAWFAARRFLLGIALIAGAFHIGTNEFVRTREIYSLTVFLLAIQPWGKIRFGFMRTLAKYSYGVYILHFFFAQVLEIFVSWNYLEQSAANVFGWTIIIYLICFGAAFLIGKLFNAEWVLPLAGGGSKQNVSRIKNADSRLCSIHV